MSTPADPAVDRLRSLPAGPTIRGCSPLHRRGASSIQASVIIPLHNERQNLPGLRNELDDLLEDEERIQEVIWVDDGSNDGSSDWLDAELTPPHQPLHLTANFGQSAAMKAGLDRSGGDTVVFMDGDGQNDPADIPRLLDGIERGRDIVSGWRRDRKAPLLRRRVPSRVANGLISALTGVKLHDYGCSLKAYRREVIEDVPLYGELHRFLPALASWRSVDVHEIEVNDRPRQHGRSHYGPGRILSVLLDLFLVKFLVDYRFRPIRIFGGISLLLFLGTFLGAGYLAYAKLSWSQSLSDHALTTVTVLLGVTGMQSLILGLLGEQMARLYTETSGAKPYVLRAPPDAANEPTNRS